MLSTQPTTITMVPFDKSDAHYDLGVEIYNSVWHEVPDTVQDWQRWDKTRQEEHLLLRYFIQDAASKAYVGYGAVMHTSWTFHPHRFLIDIFIRPEHQGKGYGKQAYNFLMKQLEPHDPMEIEGGTRTDRERAVRFLEDRGFELKTREYSSRLELATFDPDAHGDYEARLEAQGLEIVDLNQMMAEEENYHHLLYDLLNEVDRDVPWHNDPTPPPFDLFVKRFDDSPNRINECFLLARDGDQYVGMTMLFRNEVKDDTLFTGLTGVLRSHRRKGIAMALKLRALRYAKEHLRSKDGRIPVIITENEENNPMYTINERLGFEREPDWVSYTKTIRPDRQTDG